MATPERTAQAEEASLLFHVAMAQMGAAAVGDALSLWDDVPPLPTKVGARATERWLGTAVRYVMLRRLPARNLALAYYRYQRALMTGTTIAIPGAENPPYMTLPELKREFDFFLNPPEAVQEAADVAVLRREIPSWARNTQAVSRRSDRPSEPPSESVVDDTLDDEDDEAEADELDRILLEEIEDLEADLKELDEQIEAEIEAALKALGPTNMDRKMDEIPEDTEDLDADRETAHEEAGRRQAATAAREVMNGARGTVHFIGSRDKRVIGFVRVSRTGTPCGFCAMLISRGFVPKSPSSSLYLSSQGTGQKADGTIVTYGDLDLYHDNCQCYAVPVYARAELSGEIFDLNRKYAELWPIVTKGYGGKEAIKRWRRYIRQEAKSQKAQEAAA